jgi:endonuclease YncB( thermonuclease family)
VWAAAIIEAASVTVIDGDTLDVGARLVEEGLARAFRRHSAGYAPLEDMARRARRGV